MEDLNERDESFERELDGFRARLESCENGQIGQKLKANCGSDWLANIRKMLWAI